MIIYKIPLIIKSEPYGLRLKRDLMVSTIQLLASTSYISL